MDTTHHTSHGTAHLTDYRLTEQYAYVKIYSPILDSCCCIREPATAESIALKQNAPILWNILLFTQAIRKFEKYAHNIDTLILKPPKESEHLFNGIITSCIISALNQISWRQHYKQKHLAHWLTLPYIPKKCIFPKHFTLTEQLKTLAII